MLNLIRSLFWFCSISLDPFPELQRALGPLVSNTNTQKHTGSPWSPTCCRRAAPAEAPGQRWRWGRRRARSTSPKSGPGGSAPPLLRPQRRPQPPPARTAAPVEGACYHGSAGGDRGAKSLPGVTTLTRAHLQSAHDVREQGVRVPPSTPGRLSRLCSGDIGAGIRCTAAGVTITAWNIQGRTDPVWVQILHAS